MHTGMLVRIDGTDDEWERAFGSGHYVDDVISKISGKVFVVGQQYDTIDGQRTWLVDVGDDEYWLFESMLHAACIFGDT